jgi:transcriptional regulator with XRE-family HTH domain
MKKRTTMLSETIQEYLAARNMTQGELARCLDISDGYLSNMLSGNNRVGHMLYPKLLAVLV